MDQPMDRTRPGVQWLHFLLLLIVVSMLEAGQRMGAENVLTFSIFARALYTWLPALAGISISVVGPQPSITRRGLRVGFVVVALMTLMDVSGSLAADATQSTALFPDASVSPMAQASQLASVSWVRTAIALLSGELPGVDHLSPNYDVLDDRVRVVGAVAEGGLVLVVFSAIGFVIAAMSWVRTHVVFKKDQDARAFHVVLAWLVAPAVIGLSRQFARAQRFKVLFRGGMLWQPLVPSLLCLVLGLFAWWYTARYRESDDA
jgi:uncharacterized membrane protein YidH (DUF202 family)